MLPGIILDRDFRCDEEIAEVVGHCSEFSDFVFIHERKEVENYLLVPAAIDRAAARRLRDRINRGSEEQSYNTSSLQVIEEFFIHSRDSLVSRHIESRNNFFRSAKRR
jgi:hypothetical protein